MTIGLRGVSWLGCVALVLSSMPGLAQEPSKDEQAEALLRSAQQAYHRGDLRAGREQFQKIVEQFGNTRWVTAARHGLARTFMDAPKPDWAKALEALRQAHNDGGYAERGWVQYQMGVCQRALALALQKDPGARTQKLQDAMQHFQHARDWFAQKKRLDWSALARCEQADCELRLGRFQEARNTLTPFEKDPLYARNRHRPRGLYYHGLACFQTRDYEAAGRSLNQLAPFTDPEIGLHARYLVGRVLHLQEEVTEAEVHYERVVKEYARQQRQAQGPDPEYVTGAAFHLACILERDGKTAEALQRFQAFVKDHPEADLVPDAQLRIGMCHLRLGQFPEAEQACTPLVEAHPRLADQALFAKGLAQVRQAEAIPQDQAEARKQRYQAAIATLRSAADRAHQRIHQQQEAEARARKAYILLALGDAQQAMGDHRPAAQTYESIWNERIIPDLRRDEVAERAARVWARGGDLNRSDHWCNQFRSEFPRSRLMPVVTWQLAENTFARARAIKIEEVHRAADRKRLFEEATQRYQEVVERFPEFEQVSHARQGHAACLAQLGEYTAAVRALEAIPDQDRRGPLAVSRYLLAECLMRLAPAEADHPLARSAVRDRMSAAFAHLEQFIAQRANDPAVPQALWKLAYCQRRIAAAYEDAMARQQAVEQAQAVLTRLIQEHPQAEEAILAKVEQARMHASHGKRDAGIQALEALAQGTLAENPVAPLAAIHLAGFLREAGQHDQAETLLKEARERFEKDLLADPSRKAWARMLHFAHAQSVQEAGQFADARKLFEQLLGQTRGQPIGAEAALHEGLCAIAEAQALIDQGQQALTAPNLKPQQRSEAEQRIQNGRGKLTQAGGHLENRCNEFAQAMREAPIRAHMLYRAAWAHRQAAIMEREQHRQWMLREAREKQKQDLARLEPPVANLTLTMPDIPLTRIPLQHSEQRARHAYTRIIEEFPDVALSVQARLELAEMLHERSELAPALAALETALAVEPVDQPADPDVIDQCHLLLGSIHAARTEHLQAWEHFDTVARVGSPSLRGQALSRAAECLMTMGKHQEAANTLAPFAAADAPDALRDNRALALLRQGQAQLARGAIAEASETWDKVVAEFPHDPACMVARYGLGLVQQQRLDYPAAIEQFARVARDAPAPLAARAQLHIGLCHLAQQHPAEAATAFLLVPTLHDDPELSAAAFIEAARALEQMQQPVAARKLLERVIAEAPAESPWPCIAQLRL